jgi:hypothetical protein
MRYLIVLILIMSGCTTVNLNFDCYDVRKNDGTIERRCQNQDKERPMRELRERP